MLAAGAPLLNCLGNFLRNCTYFFQFDSMRILITGGAGFIGSHTTEALLARGYDVRIVEVWNPLSMKVGLHICPRSVNGSAATSATGM